MKNVSREILPLACYTLQKNEKSVHKKDIDLPLYLSEFMFRLNEGNVVIDMIDRLRSLVRGVVGKRLTYRMLVHGI